jgi:Holliday junction DNA helicase RuvA
MIGKLRGIVDSVGPDHVIVDVNGVGYEVACSARTLSALPAPGGAVTLSIETHVREDAIKLYGFLSESERGWFRLLQSVQGVGAKVALSILSTLDIGSLARSIALQDKAMITRAPGVGPKVAVRIINELKDKTPPPGFSAIPAAVLTGSDQQPAASNAGGHAISDAVSALINLGYAPAQAHAAIAAALPKVGDPPKTEELIRLGLKELAR